MVERIVRGPPSIPSPSSGSSGIGVGGVGVRGGAGIGRLEAIASYSLWTRDSMRGSTTSKGFYGSWRREIEVIEGRAGERGVQMFVVPTAGRCFSSASLALDRPLNWWVEEARYASNLDNFISITLHSCLSLLQPFRPG